MDIWALGCCFYEILTLQPLFPGENELDQLNKIHEVLGSPSHEALNRFKNLSLNVTFSKKTAINMFLLVPNLSLQGVDLLKRMLVYYPVARFCARRLYSHPYFSELRLKETPGNRLMYSKSDSSEMEKTHRSSRLKTLNLTKSSARTDIHKGEPPVKKLEIVKKQYLLTKERSWNMNGCPLKDEIMNNLKLSATNTKNAFSLNSSNNSFH